MGCGGGGDDPIVDDDLSVAVLINAESGNARSLDGEWEYPCWDFNPDKTERFVFLGDTFKRQEVTYTSTNGTCSAGEVVTTTHEGTVAAFDDFITDGWGDNNGNPLPAPMRLDLTGSLNPNPTVTKLIITVPTGPGAGDLLMFFYMDDTAMPWHLYREGAPDNHDAYSNLVDPSEPRRKL